MKGLKLRFVRSKVTSKKFTIKAFMEPNNKILYFHRQSNYPPALLKNIPQNINKRLSCISSNQQVFNEAIPPYQKALDESGYNFKLTYDPPKNRTNTQNRKSARHVTWYCPPWNSRVKTNLGRKFLNIVDKCFPKKTFPSQDLQQTHSKTQLLLYA